jgi:hypothetical protein
MIMRLWIAVLMFVALFFGAAQAQAGSCSSFTVIKSYDADSSTIEVDHSKGKMRKYFPKPDGTPSGPSKIPSSCKSKITKQSSLVVKATGGRLSMTQLRSNFQGNMLNDADDPNWLPAKLKELIEAKTQVVAVIRPGMGKDAPLGVTTIYLPITPEEEAEIERIENQGEDA